MPPQGAFVKATSFRYKDVARNAVEVVSYRDVAGNEIEVVSVMFCLRCGYANKKKPGAKHYTRADRRHMRRCDFTMTIRYRNKRTGRIVPWSTTGSTT